MLLPDLLTGQPIHVLPLLQRLQSLGPQDLTKSQLHAWILSPSQFWPNFLNLSLSTTFSLDKELSCHSQVTDGKDNLLCTVPSPIGNMLIPAPSLPTAILSFKAHSHTISCMKSAILLQVRTGYPISVLLSTLLLCTSAQPICLIILCVCLSTLLQVPYGLTCGFLPPILPFPTGSSTVSCIL